MKASATSGVDLLSSSPASTCLHTYLLISTLTYQTTGDLFRLSVRMYTLMSGSCLSFPSPFSSRLLACIPNPRALDAVPEVHPLPRVTIARHSVLDCLRLIHLLPSHAPLLFLVLRTRCPSLPPAPSSLQPFSATTLVPDPASSTPRTHLKRRPQAGRPVGLASSRAPAPVQESPTRSYCPVSRPALSPSFAHLTPLV